VNEEKASRSRPIVLFAAGFLAGALTAYYLLWRTHALTPGHPLALRPSEILAPPAPPPRTIPPTTPTPTPAAAPAASRRVPSPASEPGSALRDGTLRPVSEA